MAASNPGFQKSPRTVKYPKSFLQAFHYFFKPLITNSIQEQNASVTHKSVWIQGLSNIPLHFAVLFLTFYHTTRTLSLSLRHCCIPILGLFHSYSPWMHPPVLSSPLLFCKQACFVSSHASLHTWGLSQIHAVFFQLPYNSAEPRNKSWQWQNS